MRWDDFRRSDNVEDARDDSGGYSGGGGGFGIPGGGGGLGIGTIIILGLIGWALGIDPRILIGGAEIIGGGGGQPQVEEQYQRPERPRTSRNEAPADQMGQFVSAVLGDTEDTWNEIFSQGGSSYRKPRLVLYAGSLPTPCAYAQSAMGPFYCPRDQRIYLDTSFFRDMRTKFRACSSEKACEFAQAYVIAHEVGHHVQNLLGILPKAQQAQQAAGSRTAANRIQVMVELQADCFGGVWASRSNRRKQFLEPGDIEQALQTASAIGDDRLQKQSQGYVIPDSFTHGSSEQRKRWFMIGYQKGTVAACNTFNAAEL
ncbi:MAG TPA: neutral zinc metallopeptidase [Xanthobacteraceae bacterium]|nr:neutral zinc metallopeptidase [Xanthobacteraceae bacterium]